MTVILDGKSILSEIDFHRVLSNSLDLGEYYGRNIAALWDRLTTDVERPLHVIWRNSGISEQFMGNAVFTEYVDLLHKLVKYDEQNEWTEKFTLTIE